MPNIRSVRSRVQIRLSNGDSSAPRIGSLAGTFVAARWRSAGIAQPSTFSAMRLRERRRPCADHLGRQHALWQVVLAFELAPPRARDLAAPEQKLDRGLGIRPRPPAAAGPLLLLRLGELDLAGRERAAVGDDAQDILDERLAPLRHLAHPAPRLVRGLCHAYPQPRLELDRHERGLVGPVLEQRARRFPRERIERVAVVRTAPRERGQVVRARQHVDRVDLDHAELVDERAQHRLSHPRGPRAEALRRDREPARLDRRQRHDGSDESETTRTSRWGNGIEMFSARTARVIANRSLLATISSSRASGIQATSARSIDESEKPVWRTSCGGWSITIGSSSATFIRTFTA